MGKSDQISIQKKELPKLKKWLEKKDKKIVEIIEIGDQGIRVIVIDN